MDFLELAKSRRSVRAFEDKGVEESLLKKLLEAAQAAPSGGNCQPWRFYVIKNRQIIQKIRDLSCKQPFIATAPALFVVCAEPARSEKRYKERGGLYCIQDTAAAVQNILLCAASLGLGACWCGHFGEKEMSEILNLGAGLRPLAVIPVGYPKAEATAAPRTERRPIEEIAEFL